MTCVTLRLQWIVALGKKHDTFHGQHDIFSFSACLIQAVSLVTLHKDVIILLTLICSLYHVKEIVSFWLKYTAYVVYTLWARLREHIVTIFIMHCSVILQLVLDFWYFYLRLFWISESFPIINITNTYLVTLVLRRINTHLKWAFLVHFSILVQVRFLKRVVSLPHC